MSKVFEIAFRLGGELTSSFKNTFSSANSSMAALGAAAVAIGGAAGFVALAGQVNEVSESLSKLQAQTGVTGEQFEALKDTATNIFRDNYGESFEDVTIALAKVKQNMHHLDEGELESVTKNALMLADTFDAEVNEVTRAANNMMGSFGIESSKAFDLFAAGAQRGLNFSDEMFDNVAEYAPLWGQMGYSAEDYFGILERGSKNAYNLDYLNDIMKEFQIRTKDGSKATSDAMALMSKDTQNVWNEFLKGNGTVADVSSTVVAELQKMDDQILAGQIGVGLFGTKFEDLEADAVYAMLGTTDAMQGFEGAMEAINKIRFDTPGKAIRGIGRILFTDLVLPVGEAVLPILNALANFLSNNLPGAIQVTKSILSAIAPLLIGLAAAFVTYHSIMLAVGSAQVVFNAIQKASIVLYRSHRAAMVAYAIYGGGMTGVIQGMAAAMRTLNLTMLANPFVLAAAAIMGVGIAFYAAYKMSDKFRDAVNSSFAAVKDFVINAANFVASNAVMIWSGLAEGASGLGTRIANVLRGAVSLALNAIGSFVASNAVAIWSGLAVGVSGLGIRIADVLGSELIESAKKIVGGFVESFKTGLSSLPGIISMVAPALTTIGLGFLGVTGPVGVVIGAVVSLIGFIYRLSKTNDDVAVGIASAWAVLKEAFAPVFEVLSDGMEQFASEVGPQLSETMSVISSSIAALAPSFAELGGTLVELGSLIFTQWATLATTTLPILLQAFQTIFPIIISVVMSLVPIILQLVQIAIPLILGVVQTVFPIVLQIIQAVLPIIATLLVAVIGVILQLAQTILPLVLGVVQMVFPIVLQIIQAVLPIVATLITTVVGVILTIGTNGTTLSPWRCANGISDNSSHYTGGYSDYCYGTSNFSRCNKWRPSAGDKCNFSNHSICIPTCANDHTKCLSDCKWYYSNGHVPTKRRLGWSLECYKGYS